MPSQPETYEVVIAERAIGADGVVQLELKTSDGRPLPDFEPGAHIDVHLPNGLVRQYSLCNYQPAPDTYEIAIGLADASRGGSTYVHESVLEGHKLQISAPRNNFALVPDASTYVFIAGGIGITPILSMIRWCEMSRKRWRLLYTVRSRKRAAYLDQLLAFDRDNILLHFDDEKQGYADVAKFIADLDAQDHIYCCGPEPLMNAVEKSAHAHPKHAVHFERFSAPSSDKQAPSDTFVVRLIRSKLEITIPEDKSILECLEDAGVLMPFSCREGLCRSCETAVCAGVPDHRDYVLTDEEQASNKTMMICVSRAKSSVLDLDL
ncbi:PDR/VanB family oxidoreductase [Noviherbaspirillum sedimenti]|uniref:Oxidoreductase n=1 Tax=Noviherbaspirillum sedimenti TaxID=2320865 RepID=A0A3A3GNP1_9BURK|nr:PDR/VanB family oxidoreductase [Noviherbaspirillum sedimenti]RJG02570.1 oxidoreductase [Noviherbaspirillum sedimenti]